MFLKKEQELCLNACLLTVLHVSPASLNRFQSYMFNHVAHFTVITSHTIL